MTRTLRNANSFGWKTAAYVSGLLICAACKGTPTTTGEIGPPCAPTDLDDFVFTFVYGGGLFHPGLDSLTFSVGFEHLAGPDADPENQQFEVNYSSVLEEYRVDGLVEVNTIAVTALIFSDMFARSTSGGPSNLDIEDTYSVTWLSCTYLSERITVTDGALTVTSEPRVAK